MILNLHIRNNKPSNTHLLFFKVAFLEAINYLLCLSIFSPIVSQFRLLLIIVYHKIIQITVLTHFLNSSPD